MIYIDNNEETQVVFIPRGAVKIGVAPPVSEESLSDYYTKNQVNGLLQSYPTRTETESIVNEAVKDIDLSDYYTKKQVDDKVKDVKVDLSGYQEKLVSSENIKTINGESLLGEGDIRIEGGSGSIPHFVFTLDGENGKANLLQGDPEQLIELALGHGQFTAMLFTGDSCIDYTSVVTDWNSSVTVNFETQEDYIFIFLESGGIKFSGDFPVQTIEKLKMWGISDMFAAKQDKLVSGKNIKTVNGESLLGNGDITIEGGTVDADSLEQAITDSPYISAILARVENLEDRVDEIEENNNNMVSEL